MQRLSCQRPQGRFIKARLAHEHLQIVTFHAFLGQAVQFVDDAFLHLVGRLVGERDGEQLTMYVEDAAHTRLATRDGLAVAIGGKKQETDILKRQVKGLA